MADRNNVRVQVYNQRGKLLDSWPSVIVPWGLWMTNRDEIWVCGIIGKRAQKFVRKD